MPYNCAADIFHIKKFCSKLSSREVQFQRENVRFAFLSPLGDLGATYGDRLRLVGKCVGDFLLVLIELFFAAALRAIIGSKSAILLQWGPVDPKFQVEWVAPTNHSFSHKTRGNVLSHGIKIWTDFSFVLSQSTRLTEGRTDRQTEISLLDRVCIPCSTLKIM